MEIDISMSKGSQAADAEGASSSSKDEIVRGLNEDLAREYKAIIQLRGL
jgi:bacterioferritin